MAAKKEDPTPMLTCTVLMENQDGDFVCMNCKHLFAVICAESTFPYADTNFCPHCGAEVLERIELKEYDHFSDIRRD